MNRIELKRFLVRRKAQEQQKDQFKLINDYLSLQETVVLGSNRPSMEQMDIALRYHCKDGNVKWVSLLLWAGADPFSKGPCSPGDDPDEDEDICALEWAAIYGHVDIF